MTNQLSCLQEGFPGLTLADGTTWRIAAGDEKATAIVSRLADAMQMRLHHTPAYWLLVLTDGHGATTDSAHLDQKSLGIKPRTLFPPDEDNTLMCIFSPAWNSDMLADQLIRLSLFIARQAQTEGGLLIHGALAERDRWGVILTGPGRVGKTTASRRFPSPWRSLSDDATLVVCDEKGAYWAHPWPTWSYFMSGGPGGSWDVNHAVPLKAIFFLKQAQKNRVEPVATGQSVCLLVELAEHTSWSMSHSLAKAERRAIRLQRFENICSLATTMPCYRLHLSLNGAFWEAIERVVTEQDKGTL